MKCVYGKCLAGDNREKAGHCLSCFNSPRAPDPIVESVRAKLLQRSQVGMTKYGVGLDRTDLTRKEWLLHAQSEALDLANYLERLIQDQDK